MINGLKTLIQYAINCRYPKGIIALQKQQECFLRDCISRNIGTGLYNDRKVSVGIEKISTVAEICKQFGLFDYKGLKPYIDSENLTRDELLYMGRTSGTSDGNNGGKDIPITAYSLENGEQKAMKNTLCSIVCEYGPRFLLKGMALVLSGGFDGKKGSISGIINHHSGYIGNYLIYPSKEILAEPVWTTKKQRILADMRDNDIRISSIHGVPTWPIELVQYIIEEDFELARKIFADIRYISIGGGPALDYKGRYKTIFESIGITQDIAFTNNHNATEGFFGSQLSNFGDLDYHWMTPHIYGNWFGYIRYADYLYMNDSIPYIYTLDQVEPDTEYVQITLNHRIPVPYIIKDIVKFDVDRNYIVSGRVGMASNIANEHIEQKHILDCLSYLHGHFPMISDYHAVAGLEMMDDHKMRLHILIESDDLMIDKDKLSDEVHEWFISYHEQYAGFVKKGKMIGPIVHLIPTSTLVDHLRSVGRRHEQSKIPHIGDTNYPDIISKIVRSIS